MRKAHQHIGHRYCQMCGKKIPRKVFYNWCKASFDARAKFCPTCGRPKIEATQTSPPIVEVETIPAQTQPVRKDAGFWGYILILVIVPLVLCLLRLAFYIGHTTTAAPKQIKIYSLPKSLYAKTISELKLGESAKVCFVCIRVDAEGHTWIDKTQEVDKDPLDFYIEIVRTKRGLEARVKKEDYQWTKSDLDSDFFARNGYEPIKIIVQPPARE